MSGRAATDIEKIYIQKLIPDLGVFDIAEKYFAEGKTEENNLISANSMSGLRFMVNNCNNDTTFSILPSDSNWITYKITDNIIIFIFDKDTKVSVTQDSHKPKDTSYFVRF